jgi:hypothetical protein
MRKNIFVDFINNSDDNNLLKILFLNLLISKLLIYSNSDLFKYIYFIQLNYYKFKINRFIIHSNSILSYYTSLYANFTHYYCQLKSNHFILP